MASPPTSTAIYTGFGINTSMGHRDVASDSEPDAAIRIVLLDDEPAILKTWSAILEAHGLQPVACERAADALREIANGCDCLLTDYHMPDMTGVEVIAAARQISQAKIIVMSANDSEPVRRACIAAGAECVVSKPAPILSVIHLIEKLCRIEG